MYSTHYIQELRGITDDNNAHAEIVNGETEVFFGKIIIKARGNTVKSFFFYTDLLYICKKIVTLDLKPTGFVFLFIRL